MIEYLEEEHLYLVNGIIVPSVSQILHEKVFPDKYKGIPDWILSNKAKYGTEVHSLIEQLENNQELVINSEYIKVSINEYLRLKEKYNIKVIEQEQIVHYEEYYAGRFDMIAEINGELCLCDIKTTAELDKKYLSWQLSMYELAYGKQFDKLYAIWLPKGGLAKLIEIERIEKEKIEEIVR